MIFTGVPKRSFTGASWASPSFETLSTTCKAFRGFFSVGINSYKSPRQRKNVGSCTTTALEREGQWPLPQGSFKQSQEPVLAISSELGHHSVLAASTCPNQAPASLSFHAHPPAHSCCWDTGRQEHELQEGPGRGEGGPGEDRGGGTLSQELPSPPSSPLPHSTAQTPERGKKKVGPQGCWLQRQKQGRGDSDQQQDKRRGRGGSVSFRTKST